MDQDAALKLIREALEEVAPHQSDLIAKLTPETEIKDLGVDSIRIMEMVGNIEDRLGWTFAEDMLATSKTIGHVIVLIQTTAGRPPGP